MSEDPSTSADAEITRAIESGDLERVLALLDAQIAGDVPADRRFRLLLMRGRLRTVLGETESAQSDFQTALLSATTDAQRGTALLAAAEVAEAAGDVAAALDAAEQALALVTNAVDEASARQIIGRIERDHGDLARAIEVLGSVARQLRELDAGEDRVAEATLDLAMALRLAGDNRTSIELLEAIVPTADSPLAARLLIQIGTSWGFAGERDFALDAWERALPLLGDSVERAIVRYNRAVVYRDSGDADAAHAELSRALVENAGQDRRVEFDSLLLLAIVAREQGDNQGSIDLLREAAELMPDGDPHGRVRLELGSTLASTGLYGPAIEEFSAAIALCTDPFDRARAHRYRAAARRELGLNDAALADYGEAITLTDDPVERARGAVTRAELLVATGRRRDALDALAHAIEDAGDSEVIRQLLVQRGAFAAQFGLLDEAVSDLERAAELSSDAEDDALLASVLVDLGSIHLAMDNHDAAQDALQRALAMTVSGPVAHQALMQLGNLLVSTGEPLVGG